MEYKLLSAKHGSQHDRILKDYPKIEEEFKVRIKRRVYDTDVYITINTLEELHRFIEITTDIVIGGSTIIIYNGYLGQEMTI